MVRLGPRRRSGLRVGHPSLASMAGALLLLVSAGARFADPRQGHDGDRGLLEVDALLARFDAPSLDALLASLEPIPSLDDVLARKGPSPPHERELSAEDASVAADLEAALETLARDAAFEEARAIAEELFVLRRERLGDGHWQTLDAKNAAETLGRIAGGAPDVRASMAEAYALADDLASSQREGRLDVALDVALRQIEVRIRVLGTEHPDVAEDVNNLAVVLRDKGDYARAEALNRASVAIYVATHGMEHAESAVSLMNLAAVLYFEADYRSAEALSRKGLALLHGLVGQEHPYSVTALNNFAVLLDDAGASAQSVPLSQEALELFVAIHGERHADVATALANLGERCFAAGDLESAEIHWRRALALRTELFGEHSPKLARTLADLAYLGIQRGDGGAEALLTRGLQVCIPGSPEENELLAYLAELQLSQGKLDGAEQTSRAAIEANRRAHPGDHPDTAAATHRLAGILEAQGRWDESLRLSREALAMRRRVHDRPHWEVAQSLAAASRLLARTDVEAAEAGVREALELFRCTLGDAHWRVAACLADLAHLLESNRAADAVEAYRRAFDILDVQRTRISGDEFDRCLYSARLQVRAVAAALARGLARLGRADEAFEAVERGRERALLELLEHSSRASIVASAVQCRGALHPGELMLSYSWSPRGVMLMTASAKDEAAAFVLAEGEERVTALREAVEVAHRRILENGARAALEASLAELGRRLLPDAVRTALDEATRLVVLADGPLHAIPFSALRLDEAYLDDRWEVAHAPSASVLARSRAQRPRGEARTALIVADPLFVRSTAELAAAPRLEDPHETRRLAEELDALRRLETMGGSLTQLPGSRAEAARVSEVLEKGEIDTTVLLGADATLSRIEKLAEGKGILHFATHAVPGSVRRPFDAALVLSADADNSSFLTLERMLTGWEGRIRDCELVVLSACETQRGVPFGDSVVALPWGFLHAGAPCVVASLWQVDDLATLLLMRRFYENLRGCHAERRGEHVAGSAMSKAAALREAERWLRSRSPDENRRVLSEAGVELRAETSERAEQALVPSRDPEALPAAFDFSHPRYWSAFVLVGDPD